MKKKWISILLMGGLLLGLQPQATEAKTSVSVSVGIGSAVVAGGALIYWSVSASQRVGALPGGETHSGLTFAPITSQGEGSTQSVDRFFQPNPEDPRDLTIEIPLIQYRW